MMAIPKNIFTEYEECFLSNYMRKAVGVGIRPSEKVCSLSPRQISQLSDNAGTHCNGGLGMSVA